MLTRVPTRDLGHADGQGVQGLDLLGLVGRLQRQDDVKAATAVTAKFTGKPCVVPKVKGKSLSAAKHTLKAHACSAGKIKHAFSSKVKKGRVISQKPKAGSHLKHNGKVRLTVSKGKKH